MSRMMLQPAEVLPRMLALAVLRAWTYTTACIGAHGNGVLMLLPFVLLLHDCSSSGWEDEIFELRGGPDAATSTLIALGSAVSSTVGLTFVSSSSSSVLGPLLSGAWAAVGLLAHFSSKRRGGGGGLWLHAVGHGLGIALLWVGTEGGWLLLYARVAAFACLLSRSSNAPDARTALLQYGAVLFADQLLSLCVACAILGVMMLRRAEEEEAEGDHHHHEDDDDNDDEEKAQQKQQGEGARPLPVPPPRTVMAMRMLTMRAPPALVLPPMAVSTPPTAVDTLDVNEAFRLARAQYLSVVEKTQ